MRFKLDENLDARIVRLLADRGHDADTVLAEGLSGSTDEQVYATCRNAGRTFITLDLDFSNPFRFPPTATQGIVVVRPPRVLAAIEGDARVSLEDVQRRLSKIPGSMAAVVEAERDERQMTFARTGDDRAIVTRRVAGGRSSRPQWAMPLPRPGLQRTRRRATGWRS